MFGHCAAVLKRISAFIFWSINRQFNKLRGQLVKKSADRRLGEPAGLASNTPISSFFFSLQTFVEKCWCSCFCVCYVTSSETWGELSVGWRERKPTSYNNHMFIINFCLDMFRASLCPSSGEQRPCYCIWCTVLFLLDVAGSAPQPLPTTSSRTRTTHQMQ